MTTPLDFEDDLALVDGVEQVRVTLRGGTVGPRVRAFRQVTDAKEALPSYGKYLSQLRDFAIPTSELNTTEFYPLSTILDDDEVTWTVLRSKRMPLVNQWQVTTINLSLILTTTIHVQRRSPVKNRLGELSDEWVNEGATDTGTSPFLGLVQPITASEGVRAGRRDLTPEYRVVVPRSAAFTFNDGHRLMVGATPYQILGWDDIQELDLFPVLLVREYGK